MTVVLLNEFSYSQETEGTGSVDPYGKPDPRFRNGRPPTFKTSLEIEFEMNEADVGVLRAIYELLGRRLPNGPEQRANP